MSIDLRPYQERAVKAVIEGWQTSDRLIGSAATGAGKTIIAGEILKQRYAVGHSLFIAHREELLNQALDKLWKVTGQKVALERADDRASLGDRIVVASVQSMHTKRLERWPREHFATIIIDECHRSTAKTYKNVLDHFHAAKCLGITATPDRSDQRSLGEVFERIAFEIGLIELIDQKYLAPIRVEQIPLKIDLNGVSLDSRGDLDVNESAHALEPYLDALAKELLKHQERKTLVFLPLVRLSQQFAEAAKGLGLASEHIDGESPDRKQILARFHEGETRILSCAMLLSEGYDEPSVDCIVMLRPTQSRTLYVQCLGRGFRTAPGKTDLLVLDPLWLSTEHSLVRPANLVAVNAEEAARIAEQLGEEPDLLAAKARAEAVNLALVQQRAQALASVLDATSKRERALFDPLEFASVLADPELADFEPVMRWHFEEVSEKQSNLLRGMGVDPSGVHNKGHASAIIDRLLGRRRQQLATFRQLRYLIKYNHPNPQACTFEQASRFLDQAFGQSPRRAA